MSRNINVFGKKIKSDQLTFYIICIAVLSIYSFLEKPFVKMKYLQSDIQYFEDHYFWKNLSYSFCYSYHFYIY